MRALVNGDRIWLVTYIPSGHVQARTEIHVFKPYRPEALIETAHPFPCLAAKHEERTRGLSDGLRTHRVQTQATVMPIHRIARPYPIDAEYFEYQRGWRGKVSRKESRLRSSIRGDQQPAGGPHARIVEAVRQRIDAAHHMRVRVQQ